MLLPKSANEVNVLRKVRNCSFALLCVLCSQVLLLKAEGSAPTVVLDVEPAVERQRLRSDLLRNYDRNRRPVIDRMNTTTVSVFYEVQHILGLDEKDQILSIHGQLALSWTDQFLSWDPDIYSGVSVIRFSPEEVWLPELQAAYNVRPVKVYDKVRSPPVYVASNGSVQWYPQVRYDVPCSADYRHYPFDSHRCFLLIINYSHKIALSAHWRPLSPSRMVQGTEWTLKDVTHSVEVVHQVNVSIHLERMSRMYRYVCVAPTLISMVTLLCGFWLLPNEETRYVIGCANVIVLSMLLQHLTATVPAGRVVPLIAQYSASCLCLSAIFIVVTMVTNGLRQSKGGAPSVLVRLAYASLGRYLCIFAFSPALAPDELKRRKDWHLVSVLVDRLAFLCFAFVFGVLLAVLAAV